MQEGRYVLVEQDRRQAQHDALEQVKGRRDRHHEHELAVDRRNQRRARRDDLIHRHERRIKRQHDKVVDSRTDDGHEHRADTKADQRGLERLMLRIEQSGNDHQRAGHNKVRQLADAAGAGDEQMQQILDQHRRAAVKRPHRKAGNNRGQRAEVQLVKGDAYQDLDEEEDGRDGRQNGGTGELEDVLIAHEDASRSLFRNGTRPLKAERSGAVSSADA